MAFQDVRSALFASAAVCMCMAATPAQAQERSFNVPAQSAMTGVPEFARQADVQILVSEGVARGRTTRAVSGRMPVRRALEILLAGTGLRVASSDGRTFTLSARSAQPGEGEAGSAAADDESANQEVVVTGTHLGRTGPTSSPVAQYSREDIENTGAASVQDFLRYVPQNNASFDATTTVATPSGRSVGNDYYGSGVDIRGLGPGATLTLLNGHRLSAAGSFGSTVDVSIIPVSALQRVDILTDGASAIYGTDAIAGVANFILRRDYEGAETSARIGTTTRGGGTQYAASQLLGTRWNGGGVLAVYDYLRDESINRSQRGYLQQFAGSDNILTPQQERHSGLISANQTLGDFSLNGEAFYAHRSFLAPSLSPNFLAVVATGTTEGYGGAATIAYSPGNEWRVELTSSYSENRQDYASNYLSFPAFNSSQFTRSSLFSAGITATGPIVELPGGSVTMAIGGEYRRDTLRSSLNLDLSRSVRSAYGELFIPIVGEGNRTPGVHALTVDAAVRVDDYQGPGSATSVNPKIGITYEPTANLRFRGNFGTSFRVPDLFALAPNRARYTFNLANPASPTGVTDTLLLVDSGNPDLQPEKSRQFTFGARLDAGSAANLVLDVSYYNIAYRDKIDLPPFLNGPFGAWSQYDDLAPFFTLNPPLADVQAIFNGDGFLSDFAGQGPAGVGAILDSRLQNLARANLQGLDISVTASGDVGGGTLSGFANANYAFQYDVKGAESVATRSVLNNVYRPNRLRLRAGGAWTRDGLTLGLNGSIVGAYTNRIVTPNRGMPAWGTVDAFVDYRFADNASFGPLRNTRLSFHVNNLLDTRAPLLAVPVGAINLGYDPVNSSATGRFVSFRITKTW